ncbi:MAG: HAD family hydrolase [Sciscionella sp.]
MLDLFGTLVAAPTPGERGNAASRLADVIGCDHVAVERYYGGTWSVRHDATLPTVDRLAAHLVHAAQGPDTAIRPVADELHALGNARLIPDGSVTSTLKSLRANRLRIGVLSDASADIAAAWSTSPLATLVDAAVFSCQTGAAKPDPRLYEQVRAELDVPADSILYVGDGGGDELRGALMFGMSALAVRRRGPADTLAFGDTDWPGSVLDSVERVPTYLAERA